MSHKLFRFCFDIIYIYVFVIEKSKQMYAIYNIASKNPPGDQNLNINEKEKIIIN